MSAQLERIAKAHRTGKISVRTTVEHAIAQIEKNNVTLNFLAENDFEQALKTAAEMQDLTGPLAGVPVLIKDLEDVVGMPTRKGSVLLKDSPIKLSDSTVPNRLKKAGAIVLGKSTLPEFAIEGFTANLLDGVTRNPWNLELSPGGSSGGSAAALASGSIPIATATDGGGSIRIPSAFCGLVGLKPTNGAIGRWPVPDWIEYSTEGPMANSAADLALLAKVMYGPTAGDPSAPPISINNVPKELDYKKIYAMYRTSDLGDVTPQMAALLEQAVASLAKILQATVTWREPGSLFGKNDPDLDWFIVAPAEHLVALGRDWVKAGLPKMHPSSQEFFAAAFDLSIDEYLLACRRRFDYAHTVMQLLGNDGLLVTCTNGMDGWLADGKQNKTESLLPPAAFNTALFNLTGNPVLNLPFGVLPNGLPFGFQIVAPHFKDEDLLAIATLWEKENPWPKIATGYEPFTSYLD